MLGAAIIVFREMLEAGLILGVVLAATRGIPRRGRWIFLGVALGVLGAFAVAAFAGWISQLFSGLRARTPERHFLALRGGNARLA